MSAPQLANVPLEHVTVSQSTAQVARRRRFTKTSLAELTDSVKSHGVLQPVIVRQLSARSFELVAGERRYLAAKGAGLETVPAVVRTLTDEQVIEVQLIENLQREDVHPMEEAEGYQDLMKKYGHPIEELHASVGKSRSYVYGRLKLLALCKEAREAFYADKISASVALLIARIPAEDLQRKALKDLLADRWGDGPMSYREAAEHVQEEFMLRLEKAPFPTGDASLVPAAGPCGTCPKNTLAQPELFGDVKGGRAGVCTDPICFRAKREAQTKRLVTEAKARGQAIITGKQAKEIAPYGADSLREGYEKLGSTCHQDSKRRSWKTLLGREAKVELLQVPKSGEVIEVINTSKALGQLRKAGKLPKAKPANTGGPSPGEKAKRERERRYREALFKGIVAAAPAKIERWMLETFIARELDMGDVDDGVLEEAGLKVPKLAPPKMVPFLAELTEADLVRLAVGAIAGGEVEYCYGSPRVLEEVAKRLKVDKAKARAAAAKKPEPEAGKK